jgi:ANTAR domain
VSDSGRLRDTLRALLADRSKSGSALDRLCAGAVSALPVDGAAISVTTATAGRGFSGASDPTTARLDDLQFTLGEGPGWDSAQDGHPVLVGDLTGVAGSRWPVFTAAVLAAGFQAIFTFPLRIGAIRLGTLVLVRVRPGTLDAGALADALIITDVAALTLIDAVGGGPLHQPRPIREADPLPDVSWLHRAEIHQATGMVMAQLGVGAQEALVRLRAHAFACGQSADEVAREVVARRLRFESDQAW